jgi:hypothetical protein
MREYMMTKTPSEPLPENYPAQDDFSLDRFSKACLNSGVLFAKK